MSQQRGSFTNRLGFIAAAAGSAVGLGNIWKFPFETGENGGAAFLVIYLLCAFIICMPIMVGEIAMGRNARLNPYGTYKKLGGKKWAAAGFFGILCGIMILSFYNVVAGWAFGYFLQISFGDLLNEPNYGEYFGRYVANVGDNLIFSFAFMILTAAIVIGGVKKGIERWTKILMPLLIIIMVGLIIYGVTLPNAGKGLEFYLIPDFTEVTANTLYMALSQAFFSLSLGMGAIITYGSYISKNDNIVSSAALVTTTDMVIAFMAGLMIFPLVFYQPEIEASAGPGLVFVSLPAIFEAMGPMLGKVIGGIFFLLLCFAALTSTVSLLEVPTAYVTDEFKFKRKATVVILAALIFLIGLPSMLSHGAVDGLTNFLSYGKETAQINKEFETSNFQKPSDLKGQEVFLVNSQNENSKQENSPENSWKINKINAIGDSTINSVIISNLNQKSDTLKEQQLSSIRWEYTPRHSFMTVIIDIFSDIGLPLGGFLISIFVAYKWHIRNYGKEIEKGHPNFLGSIEQKFVGIMLGYISPVVIAMILIVTILNRFFGVDLLSYLV